MTNLRQASPQNKAKLLAAARRAGLRSQAALARRIHRDPTYFWRVINRKVKSAVVWAEAWAAVRSAVPEEPSVMSMAMGESNHHAASR
jgi:hypothetical protein